MGSEELIYCRQRHCYLINLQDDIAGIKNRLKGYRAGYNDNISSLRSKVASGQGELPKMEVYPLFDALGRIAGLMEIELKLAVEKLRLLDILRNQKENYQPVLTKDILDCLKFLSKLRKSQPDEVPIEKSEQIESDVIPILKEGMQYISATSNPEFLGLT